MKFKYSSLLIIAVFYCSGIVQLNAQEIDFKNYSSLKSQGKIPLVFQQTSDQKVIDASQRTREKMDEEQKAQFLEYIHYGIDELLHSGLIVYGDPATKYVEKVAHNLLANHPELKSELQFFVLKSNVSNALSTDQGVIFVTLGLLSQLENEAQLAYVLAHEISHFQENHVEKSYTEKVTYDKTVGYDLRIEMLSTHSKDQELEADKLGIELYNKAGYKKSELLSAFDVMMYSYLPFDEEPLPLDYFNNQYIKIPVNLFPEAINKIQVDEDYDDSKSSHPNIRKRKEAVKGALADYPNWGESIFLADEKEFNTVRNIARFESLRLDVLYSHFGDALYSVFLLEKEYPGNLFVSRLKAQSWLGLTAYKASGNFSNTLSKPSKVEGESHAMHYLLSNFSKIELYTVALRMIQDIKYQFPEDDEINEIYSKMVEFTVEYSKFNLSDYSDMTYDEALESFENSKIELENKANQVDSVEVEKSTEELSKYDKIKIKRDGKVASKVDEEFDSEKFYIYALSDLKKNEAFAALNRKFKQKEEEIKKEEDAYFAMTKKQRQEADKLKVKPVTEVVLIDPSFDMIDKGVENERKSKELEARIIASIKSEGEKYGISVYDATDADVVNLTTDGFNERALLTDFIRQKGEYDEVMMFPVDYTALKEIKNHYGDVDLLFTFGEHKKTMSYSPATIILSVLLPPFGVVYGVIKLTSGNQYRFNALLVNLSTNEMRSVDNFYTKQKPNNAVVKGSIYQLMTQLKGKK
jgi:hypothetical protein